MPLLEQLVVGRGQSVERPLRNLTLRGITFEHSGWLGPNSPEGYVAAQAAVRFRGTTPMFMGSLAAITGVPCQNLQCEHTPAAVSFHLVRGITLDNCTVTHSGSAGVYFGDGAQSCSVTRCRLHDLAASAVSIGRADSWGVTDPRLQETGIEVTQSHIWGVGMEFHGAAAIWAGFWKDSKLLHNTIESISYSAIHVGWGWRLAEGYSENNEIAYNRLSDIMMVMDDGGGIYTSGPQPGTIVHNNYVSRMVSHTGGCLYHDDGSAYITSVDNVCDTPLADGYFVTGGSPPGHPTTHDINVTRTYTNNPIAQGSNATCHNCVVSGNSTHLST